MRPSAFLSAVSVLLFSIASDANCEYLKQLLFEKYRSRIELNNFVSTRINAHGVVEQVVIPPPMTPERRVLLNPQNIAALDNFEYEPEAVYNHQNMKHFVVSRAVKDYETDHISRDIIHYCLEYCNQEDYLKMLLVSAAEFNVPSLIDKIVSMVDISLVDFSTETLDQDKSFTSTIIRFGNYHIAKSLMLKGIQLDSAPVWINIICMLSGWNHIEATKEFLEFLVIRTELWDMNTPYLGSPFLHHILRRTSFNESDFMYKSFMAQLFVSNLGADPRIRDGFGITALDYARSQGIDLEYEEHQ